MSEKNIIDCVKFGKITGVFDETKLVGDISIADLLSKPFDKHVGSFEIPTSLREMLNVDEVNAVITWYLIWKKNEPVETQNTCTIKKVFGYNEGIRVIVAINLFKYLRNKSYDPDVVEKFLKINK